MYLDHFGLLEPPFRITPHTDFFFSGANRGATLEALLYAITHDEGIVKVTGEVGSGKTMLCRVLIERLPTDVETVYLANPSLEREEILQAVLDDLKFTVPTEQKANQLLRTLQEHLISLYGAGKRVVLLIDEAHAMPPETLEQIRLLSNLESNRHKLLQIALFGQQELDDHLGTTLLRPLRERVTHSFRLEPLVHADVGQYLMFRMRQAGYKGPDLFDRNALKLIAKSSEGLTRRLNILADKCLLAAFVEGEHGITRKHAMAAIGDSGFAPLGPRRTAFVPSLSMRRQWLILLTAIATMAGGIGMMLYAIALIRGDVVTGMKNPALEASPTKASAQPLTEVKPKGIAAPEGIAASMGSPVRTLQVTSAATLPDVAGRTPVQSQSAPIQGGKPPVEVPQVTRASSRFPVPAKAQPNSDAIGGHSASPKLDVDESRLVPKPEPQFFGKAVSENARPIPMPKPRFSAVTRSNPRQPPQVQPTPPSGGASSRTPDSPWPAPPELPLNSRAPSRDD